jgi:prepilin-type N-terminal cleavage/methylation domain-containing protein
VPSRTRSIDTRGFTLVELLIVVAIIAIVAVLAIPTMSAAQIDRHVFTDAGYVGELFRIARTRAVGRGAAVLVKLTATNTNGGGTFSMYEAVVANPAGGGSAEIPSSSCKAPTRWPGASGTLGTDYEFVDAVNLSGTYEQQNSIAAQVKDPSGTVLASGTDAFLCFTPGGRIYYVATTPTFDNVTPLGGAIQIDVRRFSGTFATAVGLTRTVWVTSSGSTRIVSQ